MIKRQGELLIIKINKMDIPLHEAKKSLKKKKTRILAEGEVTGHMHELDKGKVFGVNTFWNREATPNQYFNVPRGETATLTHPEHGALTFDEGLYKVITQREYSERGIERVRD